MTHFDDVIETSNRTRKRVRVPGLQGASDRIIYVNGNCSEYKLGSRNNFIYNRKSGAEVSRLSLKEFAKNFLWCIWKNWYYYQFFCFLSIKNYTNNSIFII